MGETVHSEGTLQPNETAAPPYGAHLLLDDGGNDPCALRSEDYDLDDYVGELVTVAGALDPDSEEFLGDGPALVVVSEIERGRLGN